MHDNQPATNEPGGGNSHVFPASFAQERLWVLERLEPDSPRFNIPAAFRLRGPLAVPALARALARVVERHESLRTHFRVVDEELCQVVLSHPPPPLRHVDLRHLPEGTAHRALRELTYRHGRSPFDLTRGTLFRSTLVMLGREEHALLLNLHHSIADGLSMGIIYRELEDLYETLAQGGEPHLSPLPIQYADFAAWQREHLRGELLEKKIEDWRSRLDGAPELLEVPRDHPRPQGVASPGRSLRRPLPTVPSRRLAAFVADSGVTPFAVLLAAFLALLKRHTGQHDLVVGTALAGRTEDQVRNLVGYFANALPIRVSLTGDPAFRELVDRTRSATLETFAHQDVPFERLVEALVPERRPGHLPLVQVVFLLDEHGSGAPLELPGLEVEEIPVGTDTTKYDLTLTASVGPERLEVTATYRSDLYEEATVGRFLESYEVLLATALAQPETAVSRLPVLPPRQRQAMLHEWNDTAAWGDPPWRPPATAGARPATLHRRFLAVAADHPGAPAVSGAGGDLTYGELAGRSRRLAHRLRALGIGPEDRVGVALPRDSGRIVAILGILQAGGAYVPLDLSYPSGRLAHMLDEARVGAVVTAGDGAADTGNLPTADRGLQVWPLPRLESEAAGLSAEDDPRDADLGADQLAYVLFTSGSTGRPKAVAVPHRGVLRLVLGQQIARLAGPGRTVLHFAPLSFDASTFELWAPLANGGRVAVAPSGPTSLEELAETVRREGVTTAWLTAGLFHQMVERQLGALGVDHLLTGGDVVSPSQAAAFLEAHPDSELIDGYGPTENTVFTTTQAVAPALARSPERPIPIGRPVAGTTVHVVDRELRLVPPGVFGELVAGGDGLARGYAGDPRLTATRFVPDPFTTAGDGGRRLYRTGDRVRRSADGRLDFHGRLDRQVKLRGFRIEPGEVESVLSAAPGIAHCVVTLHGETHDEARLVAYVEPTDDAGQLDAATLRVFAVDRLPDVMVPGDFVIMDKLPLTPQGKVDRDALPAPQRSRHASAAGYVAPRNPTEEKVTAIWSEILGVERLGIHDDFFALGGHSLLANRIVLRVKTVFGVELPLRNLFEAPTVAGFTAGLERRLEEAGPVSPGSGPIQPMDRSKRRITKSKPAAGRERGDNDAV